MAISRLTPSATELGPKIGNGQTQSSFTAAEPWNQASPTLLITPLHEVEHAGAAKVDVSRASFEDIYPIADLLSPAVQVAHRLLDDACKRVRLALEFKEAGDEFASDDQLQHVVVILRELFCCREIGDGFGAVTNAALAGLENLNGKVATVRQLTALSHRLNRIQIEPFISLSDAALAIEAFEDADLDVRPPGFQIVEDWLLDD